MCMETAIEKRYTEGCRAVLAKPKDCKRSYLAFYTNSKINDANNNSVTLV